MKVEESGTMALLGVGVFLSDRVASRALATRSLENIPTPNRELSGAHMLPMSWRRS